MQPWGAADYTLALQGHGVHGRFCFADAFLYVVWVCFEVGGYGFGDEDGCCYLHAVPFPKSCQPLGLCTSLMAGVVTVYPPSRGSVGASVITTSGVLRYGAARDSATSFTSA